MKTVEISQERYEELLRAEAFCAVIKKFHARTTGYSFHDVVGFLITECSNEKPEEV